VTTLVIGLYIACNIIANVTASKPVMVGGIVVPAAVFRRKRQWTSIGRLPLLPERSPVFLPDAPVFDIDSNML